MRFTNGLLSYDVCCWTKDLGMFPLVLLEDRDTNEDGRATTTSLARNHDRTWCMESKQHGHRSGHNSVT